MFNVLINVIEELKVQKITALSELIKAATAAWPKGLGRGTALVKADCYPSDDPSLCWGQWEDRAAPAPSPALLGCSQS